RAEVGQPLHQQKPAEGRGVFYPAPAGSCPSPCSPWVTLGGVVRSVSASRGRDFDLNRPEQASGFLISSWGSGFWLAAFQGEPGGRYAGSQTTSSLHQVPTMSEVTRILAAIEQGQPHAAEQLLPLVYGELRQLAAQRLAHEAPGQTLQPTALVH